jgi:hypothetical protein
MADAFLEQIETELKTLAAQQRGRFQRIYGGAVVVPGGGTATIDLQIDGDGDFLAEHLSGICAGPVDANGRPQAAPPSAFGGATATRGLLVSITDRGSGRNLTNGFIDCALLFTPGYGTGANNQGQIMGPLVPFRYLIERTALFRFEFRSQETDPAARQYAAVALHGKTYAVRPQR